jgi:hypothetical protein
MMIEYPDPIERAARLAKLIGIEDEVWVRVNGCDPVYAIADEDMERENEEKTSAVHFLRFELAKEMIKALHQGSPLSMGIDHNSYEVTVEPVPSAVRESLIKDLAA